MADEWDAIEKPTIDDDSECAGCGYVTRALTPYRRGGFGGGARRYSLLCELCESTRTGNAEEYPRQYPGQQAILQTICYVGNVILAELRKAKS